MNVLGIESSCDETSVAIIKDGELKSNLISSQDFHKKYGGVVPELSSRAHLQIVNPLLNDALKEAKVDLEDIDVISATAGPGLIGALLVGLTFAKGLAFSLKKPFIPVNHIEGHIFSSFLMKEKPEFPILTLVVSGGHTMLLIVEDFYTIRRLGTTIDDAVGEAFDKVAKMLGLGYPGGPKVSKLAENGNRKAIPFPIPHLKNKYDFSYSGIKTSVLYHVQKNYKDKTNMSEVELSDICASFEHCAISALTKNIEKALKEYNVNTLSVVGGVAANKYLRARVTEIAEKNRKKVVIPDFVFCGDNAAMIAYRGMKIFESGKTFNLSYKAFPSFFSEYFV